MNVLVTGANGFIGRALCSRLASDNKVVGVDITGPPDGVLNINWERADLTDLDSVAAVCEKYFPDVVIHCAGIAHQKIGTVDSVTYMRVNSEATENFAKAVAKSNPAVRFIFLSSVSVYGEGPQITQISQIKQIKTNNKSVGEDSDCWPSSDYAVSKLDAERRLVALADGGIIHNLIILRLAPVYDRDWSLNLDRRVFAPKKLAYLRFGSGTQKMSALGRPNLVDFIAHILQSADYADFRGLEDGLDSRLRGNDKKGCGNDKKVFGNNVSLQRHKQNNRRNLRIYNVCDEEPYEFNKIIRVFKKSGIHPNRPVISAPLSVVWLATRIAGLFLPNKRNWLHSCYDKLASDLVFNNEKMLGTGFKPRHSLETVFAH